MFKKLPSGRTLAFLLLACLTLAGGSAVGLYAWLIADLPPVSSVATRQVRPTTQIVDRNGRLLYEVVDPEAGKQLNLSLESVPEACVQATLATEDSRFYYHPGFDPIAIARAAWQNYQADGRVVSGGSTLTQQLARNLLLAPEERYEQTLRRKLREAWMAWRLESHHTKDELLALYLNQTYYGNFAFGLEAASQAFFAKPAVQLSRGECTLLAGLVQYPSGYNPLQDPEIAKARQETVLRLMTEMDYITTAEARQIAQEPLRYRSNLFDIRAPHFVMHVQDLLAQRLGVHAIRQGGLRIVTTLDLDLQKQAIRTVRHHLDLLNCRMPGACDAQTDPNRRVDNAASVVLDTQTGDILSMVGSPDYFDATIQGNVNAALAMRQPGSAIKPLTYAAALDPAWAQKNGYEVLTPATILPDLPATFYVQDEDGGNVPYQPLNYDRKFHGPVSVRTALGSSYNIPAVRVAERIGVDNLQRIAGQAGITTFTEEYGLALTLGGGEVRLLDLATAYGIFQNGRRLDTHAILDIQHQNEQGEWESIAGYAPASRTSPSAAYGAQVIAPSTAYLLTDILSDSLARRPAFGSSSVLDLPFPSAVKTGTTTDWRDNWTVGYSTGRIVGVWVGNADNTPMLDVSGIDGAGPIWHDIMLAAHPNSPPPFDRPDNIVDVSICAPSGKLPTEHCPRIRKESFIAGTEPIEYDTQFQPFEIDRSTGLPAGPTTPAEERIQRVYWVLPPAYHDWMVSRDIPLPPQRRIAGQATDRNANYTAGERAETAAPPEMTARGSQQDTGGEHQQLVLDAPTANIAYRIHPGVPRDRQRIEVSGYSADGQNWSTLRLVKDGEVLTQARDATRLQTWWVFTPGDHTFWLEGRRTPSAPLVQSSQTLVVIEDSQGDPGSNVETEIAVETGEVETFLEANNSLAAPPQIDATVVSGRIISETK